MVVVLLRGETMVGSLRSQQPISSYLIAIPNLVRSDADRAWLGQVGDEERTIHEAGQKQSADFAD
jgi:hypothetical protein